MGLTDEELRQAQERADEIAARPPAELVPMVLIPGAPAAIEIVAPQCGLVRCPSGYEPGDSRVVGVWTVNEHDPVPCEITGVGIVHEAGGPWMFAVPVDRAGGRVDEVGGKVTVSIPWPIKLTVS